MNNALVCAVFGLLLIAASSAPGVSMLGWSVLDESEAGASVRTDSLGYNGVLGEVPVGVDPKTLAMKVRTATSLKTYTRTRMADIPSFVSGKLATTALVSGAFAVLQLDVPPPVSVDPTGGIPLTQSDLTMTAPAYSGGWASWTTMKLEPQGIQQGVKIRNSSSATIYWRPGSFSAFDFDIPLAPGEDTGWLPSGSAIGVGIPPTHPRGASDYLHVYVY